METFAIYADWMTDAAVTDEELRTVNRLWSSRDESFCSSADRHQPEVLILSFDVSAETAEAAYRPGSLRIRRHHVGRPRDVGTLVGRA